MSKLDNLPQINTNSPRETLVYSSDGLVIKRPGPRAPSLPTWLAKQRHAQAVAESLKRVKNPTYFVPAMLEISKDQGFAVEELVPGQPLKSSYFDTLSDADKDIIYRGFANFVNDINQSHPVLTQAHVFDSPDGEDGTTMPFNKVMKDLKKYVSAKDLKTITNAKAWFDNAALHDASVVFSHGDMNEDNIFFDVTTKTLSVIDFADAKYENAHYMFNRDLARLGWLDIDRLISEYMALSRAQPVIIKTDKMVETLRNRLKNFVWSASAFLANPKIAPKTRLKIIDESIKGVKEIYDAIMRAAQFEQAGKILGTTTQTNMSDIATSIIKKQNNR